MSSLSRGPGNGINKSVSLKFFIYSGNRPIKVKNGLTDACRHPESLMPVAPLGGEGITSSSFAFELNYSKVVKNMLLFSPIFYSGAFVPKVDFASCNLA